MAALTWGSPDVAWSDPYVSWDGVQLKRPFQLGVDVAIGAPDGMWALGVVGNSELGTSTRLAATADLPGIWLPLDCDLVEVQWTSGARGEPPHVLARPDPGTCDLTMIDPDLSWLPPAGDPQGGLGPGRALRVVDRADGLILWSGWVETLTWDRGPDDPLHHLRVTAVDTVTMLVNGPQVDALPVQTAAARAAAVLAYRPELPASVIDPAATYTVAPVTGPTDLWEALTAAADAEIGYLWVDRDGGVRLLSHDVSLGATTSWPVPPCAPVLVHDEGFDLMAVANTWTITRREHDDTDTPTPQTAANADAVGAFGMWSRTLTDWPAADDGNTLRAAALGATAKGWPRASYGGVRVDVAASGADPALLDLVRVMRLGDQISEIPIAGPAIPPQLVIGWAWTWTAAGGLAGELSTAPPPYTWSETGWLLAVAGRSELSTTTVLGG